MKKRGILLLAILLLIGLLPACSKEEEAPEEAFKPEKLVVVDTSGDVSNDIPYNENPLTGIGDLTDEAIGKRPVAVMVNNIMAAMPQYGVEQADIIFEIPVEGDSTRMMALYGDYTTVPKVCAVRSCRYYFPAFSEGFDAFYVHWGIDQSKASYVNGLTIDRYDGLSNTVLFGRDTERRSAGYAVEHTGYFDGTLFAETVQEDGKRVDLEADKQGTAFIFNGVDEQIAPEGDACTKVEVKFGAQYATLTYDAENNVYLKDNCGEPQIDGKTGNQLAFTNVFVLETSISVRDSVGHKNLDWKGGPNAVGYYISNGAVQKIAWSKESEDARLRFFDESGEELSINRGKSYIAVNYADKTTFE